MNNMTFFKKEKDYFLAAIMFYTRLPVPKDSAYSETILNQSRKYFPAVGVIIGFIAAISILMLQALLPLSVAILLSIALTVIITGAFHEDGFADCCDAFGAGWNKTQILTIMKDSRVGSYAVVGIALLFSLKFMALYEIGKQSTILLFLAYINGHAVSRFGASLSIELLEYVQDTDTSKIKPITSMRLPKKDLLFSMYFVLPSFLFLVILKPIYGLTIIPLCVCFLIVNRYFKKRIGGYTGDCLGAMQQILELIFYLSVLSLSAAATN